MDNPDYLKQVGLICDVRDVLVNAPQGERVMRHLEERFYFNASTATADLAGRPTALMDRDTMIFAEGQRSVVLYLKGLAAADTQKLADEYKLAREAAQAADDEVEDIGV